MKCKVINILTTSQFKFPHALIGQITLHAAKLIYKPSSETPDANVLQTAK